MFLLFLQEVAAVAYCEAYTATAVVMSETTQCFFPVSEMFGQSDTGNDNEWTLNKNKGYGWLWSPGFGLLDVSLGT